MLQILRRVIICSTGLVKYSVTKPPNAAEYSINKIADIVEKMVLESMNNGFIIVYATAGFVTNEMYDEICSRPNIR